MTLYHLAITIRKVRWHRLISVEESTAFPGTYQVAVRTYYDRNLYHPSEYVACSTYECAIQCAVQQREISIRQHKFTDLAF